MLKELLFAAKQLGMDLDFKPVARRPTATRGRRRADEGRRYVITAIGPTLGAPHLHAIASTLAAEGANIEKIGRLSENTLASVEIHALLPPGRDSDALKRTLLSVATNAGFDVSLQRESLYRRSKRLVVMDMDSTLIRIEVIDELARAAGVGAAGLAHHRARDAGRDGLRRVAAPARRPAGRAWTSRCWTSWPPNLPLTDGAETLIRVLKRLGYRIAVISGGFSRAAEALKRRLGVDYAYSNNLEVAGRQAHRPRRRADRQRAAQGGAAGDDRAGRGRAAGSGDRRRRRRERRADAGTRGPGHRVPRQAQAARGGRHQHLGGRASTPSSTCSGSPRGSCKRWSEGRRDTGARRWRPLPPRRWRRTASEAVRRDGPDGRRAAHPGVHLSWVRGEGAGVCPDAAAIEAEVSERLGGNPFARTPTQFIEAIVTQKAAGFEVSIAMRASRREAARQPRADQQPRRLPVDRDRRGADDRDPDRSRCARARARAQAAAPPRRRRRPRPARAFRPGGSPRSAARAGGWCPGVAAGAGLAATVDVARPIAVGLPTVFYPESRTAAPDDGFAFGLTYASWSAASCRSRRRRVLRLEVCAGATAGVLHAVVFSGTPTEPGQRWTFAAAQLTRVIIPIYQGAGGRRSAWRSPNPCPAARFSLKGARLGWTLSSSSQS